MNPIAHRERAKRSLAALGRAAAAGCVMLLVAGACVERRPAEAEPAPGDKHEPAAVSGSQKSRIPLEVTGAPVAAAPDEEIDVEITITAIADVRDLEVEYRGGPEVDLDEAVLSEQYGDLRAGESIDVVVSARPRASGWRYVYLQVTGTFGSVEQASAYAVAIDVKGDAAGPQSLEKSTVLDDDGRRLIEYETETR